MRIGLSVWTILRPKSWLDTLPRKIDNFWPPTLAALQWQRDGGDHDHRHVTCTSGAAQISSRIVANETLIQVKYIGLSFSRFTRHWTSKAGVLQLGTCACLTLGDHRSQTFVLQLCGTDRKVMRV